MLLRQFTTELNADPGPQSGGDGSGTALDMDRWFPEDMKRVSLDGEGGKKGGRYRV